MDLRDRERCLRRLYSINKSMAKKRGIEFKLERPEYYYLVEQKCGYCGAEGSNLLKYGNLKFQWIGLDRIDNEKGYESKNVIPACRFCNSLRGSMSFEFWAEFVDDISELHKGERTFRTKHRQIRHKKRFFKR